MTSSYFTIFIHTKPAVFPEDSTKICFNFIKRVCFWLKNVSMLVPKFAVGKCMRAGMGNGPPLNRDFLSLLCYLPPKHGQSNAAQLSLAQKSSGRITPCTVINQFSLKPYNYIITCTTCSQGRKNYLSHLSKSPVVT